MFIVIWQYTIDPKHLHSFIHYYHNEGEWVKFFHPAVDYFGSEFIRTENENQFITIDKWMNEESYEQFLHANKKKYDELDKHCEGFTLEESLVGKYYLLEL